MNVADIANEIFIELDSPSDISVPSISFWLTSNIGKLNNLIDTAYYIENSEIVPELQEDEKSIFKMLYSISYFNRQVQKNLGAAAYVTFTDVKEGGRSVKRASKTEVAKNYRSMVTDLNDDLMAQLMNYKMNRMGVEQFTVRNPVLEESSNVRLQITNRDDTRNLVDTDI